MVSGQELRFPFFFANLRQAAGGEPAAGNDVLLAEETLRRGRDRVEKAMIVAAMERTAGNIVQTAKNLGISRPAVYALMKKHGLHFTLN